VVLITEGGARRKRKPMVEKLTPELMSQLIAQHSQCLADQFGKCYLTVFAAPLCWLLNRLLGLDDEVGEGFKLPAEMTAAKPVKEEHFDDRED
jgi:hypothetical protein